MSDVRSMLRSERASRRVAHPHASYTSSGQLTCNVCNLILKSDSLWDTHSRTSQHLARSKEAERDSQTSRGVAIAGGKKRKASEDEDDEETERKKSKNVETSKDDRAHDSIAHNGGSDLQQQQQGVDTTVEDRGEETYTTKQDEAVDADQWAAFERDMANLERREQQTGKTAVDSTTSYEAPPVSAAELESRNAQRTSADAEVEDEKDEAARELQEELEEMDELERRVQELKAKREALKLARNKDVTVDTGEWTGGAAAATPDDPDRAPSEDVNNDDDDEDDDDDDDDDGDEWAWGGAR